MPRKAKTTTTTTIGTDAERAVALVAWARRESIAVTGVSVGSVRIDMLPVHGGATASLTPPTADDARRLFTEYGGAELAQMLQTTHATLLDDEDEPAVRS